MKKEVIFTSVFILLAVANIFAGGFELTFGGGFSTFGLSDLKDDYKTANHIFSEKLYMISYDKFDENMSGGLYLYEMHYCISPKLRVGTGYMRMSCENYAEQVSYSPLIGPIYEQYKDEIKYNLFYLSAKYNIYESLYAGLRIGWGNAIFHDYYDRYELGDYVVTDFSRQEFDTAGFLLMPSMGVEKNMWRCFHLGIDTGYRYFPMKEIENHYPNQVEWAPEWESMTIDLDSSGFFMNLFMVVKL